VVQVEKALGLEVEALAQLQEIHAAARVGRTGHADPAAVADFQRKLGHDFDGD
jgi:hypothetical protein